MLRNGMKPTFRFSGCLRAPAFVTTISPRTTPKWRTYSASAGPNIVPTPSKPYYVTTPIFYVNAVPHIGHLFSGVLADVLTRYARLKDPNREVHFCTGTDEHGLKIQRAAEAKAIAPKPFCDGISTRFEDLAKAAGLSHTRFIRTTEPVHYKAVEHLWRELLAGGWIYKGSHSGWYSVSDEAFYAPNQIIDVEIDGETVKVAKESGSRVEWMEEENYKFRLSAFREKLIEWLESNPRSIVPLERWKEVHSHLAEHVVNDKGEKIYTHPLEDLSISRPSSRLSWGIPVPDDPEHTIYVWIDALTNYITALGYPWSGSGGKQAAWPADVQVIGVDIVR
ncbi:methionyl-tRNA synthetase [Tulasnella sp. 417]|nr:methionyl-tRNA synthetase [Tulasnella sp. 417]